MNKIILAAALALSAQAFAETHHAHGKTTETTAATTTKGTGTTTTTTTATTATTTTAPTTGTTTGTTTTTTGTMTPDAAMKACQAEKATDMKSCVATKTGKTTEKKM